MTYECVVVIPVYNEATHLLEQIQSWHAILSEQCGDHFQLVYIDDGSTDNSAQIITEAKAQYPQIVLIQQENKGHGAAILAGYHYAVQQDTLFVFQTDADMQIPASDFAKLWPQRHTARCTFGCREGRVDPWHRRMISQRATTLIRWLFKFTIADPNVPFRLYERSYLAELLRNIPQNCFAPNIFLAIAAKKRHSDVHIPITHMPRKSGQSSLPSGKLLLACLRTLIELIRYAR